LLRLWHKRSLTAVRFIVFAGRIHPTVLNISFVSMTFSKTLDMALPA
ncbi:hypothetical protein LINGRAHAP2_LOCUS34970, partial [Linum grandiflorum]